MSYTKGQTLENAINLLYGDSEQRLIDACPKCQDLAEPKYCLEERHNIKAHYECDNCGHHWQTWYDKTNETNR